MRKILLAVLVFCLCAGFFGCAKNEPAPGGGGAEAGVYGEGKPVTRGEAARTLALCLYDYNEICALDPSAVYSDIDKDDRLYKYVNAAFTAEIMAGDGERFRPGDYLTVGEAETIIENCDKSGRLSIEVDSGSEENPVSYYIWIEILSKMLEAGDFSGVSAESGVTLKIGKSGEDLYGYAVLDKGLFRTDGFLDADLEERLAEFLIRGDSIIGVISVVSEEIELKSCLVLNIKNGEAEVFADGVKKIWKCDLEAESELPFGADIKVAEGRITEAETFATEKEGRVIAAGDGRILFDDGYSYDLSEDFMVYNTYDGLSCGDVGLLVSGENLRVMFKDNKAVCGICVEKFDPDVIRIALSAEGGGLLYKSVSLGASGGFCIGENEFGAGEMVEINAENKSRYFAGRLSTLESLDGGSVTIDGKEYEGKADIIAFDDGFAVVLETDLEYYLSGVVCAEMPASYGEEALKAQALAARSYAYNQRAESSRINFGANVDDTVSFQVFDADSICDESIKAVNETAGEVILYNGEVINACFYSTSCGIGANSGEIWGKDGIYPWVTPEYLTGRVIGEGSLPDFSDEDKAMEFFKKTDDDAYEKEFPYYRWSIAASATDFTADVGAVENVEIVRRGEGGNVMEILIEGEEADETVIGESNVRKILKKAAVKRSDGTTVNFNGLPSTFFAAETVDGIIYFYGGGYGHGAGMSQNGAKVLGDLGYSYKEIAEYFYDGAKVGKINQ